MWFLYLLSYVAFFVQILFIVISIAAGLYYLAEIVEEYTVASKKVIWWMSVISLVIYVCFILFEEFPISMNACGILAHLTHLLILNSFPVVVLSSPQFLLAIIMLVVNHYLAFSYFGSVYHPFSEVIGYFTLCLWLVPFALFVSLSANENVLPTHAETTPLLNNDVVSNYFSRRGKKYGLLSFFNYAKESILPQRNKKVF